MAANSKQGIYTGTTLAGFTGTVAGLVIMSTHTVMGWLVAGTGIALLGLSTIGFFRLKQLEVRR